MSIEPFPQIGKNDDLNKVRESLGELCQVLDFMLNGGLDTLNIHRLIADKIYAGTINANNVTITASNGAYSYTFDGTGITANNGVIDTLRFDLATGQLTILSALIKSATGYPRLTLDPSTNTFSLEETATKSVSFFPNYLSTTPAMNFHDGSVDAYIAYLSSSGKFAMFSGTSGVEVEISTSGLSGDVSLRPVDNVNVPRWSKLINEFSGNDLQTDLNAKANAFSGSTTSVSVVTSVDFGGSTYTTNNLNFTNGVLTSIT